MTIYEIFKNFYGVDISLSPSDEIKLSGMDRLSQEKRRELVQWVKDYREHVINRLKSEKGGQYE